MPLYGSQDIGFARKAEDNRISLVAQCVEYWQLNRGGGPVDPLYNEPVPWEYDDANDRLPGVQPMTLSAVPTFSEVNDKDVSVVEEGQRTELTGKLKFSYLEWCRRAEKGTRPKAGDVVKVSGRYFDVVKGSEAGYMNGTKEFVGWQLDIRQRSDFTPDRRLP